MDSNNSVRKLYEKVFNDFYMHDLSFYKMQVKKMFKSIKRVGLSFCANDNIIANYIKDNLPYEKPDFSFTLMNAQHCYALCLGFSSWSDLRHFCNV